MNTIICFIIGFLLAKLANYIDMKRYNKYKPKTLNIGDSDEEIITITSEMLLFEIEHVSDLQKFDSEFISDNTLFYISSTNKYIQFDKDRGFRYVKIDVPLRGEYLDHE